MANSLALKWTDDDVNKLIELCNNEVTPAKAAEALGRSKSSVISKARQLNLWFLREDSWTSEDIDTLRDMASKGRSVVEIAGALSRSCRAVRAMAKFWGIYIVKTRDSSDCMKPKRYRDSWTVADDAYLSDGIKSGVSPEQLASDLERSIDGIYSRMSKLGITICGVC